MMKGKRFPASPAFAAFSVCLLYMETVRAVGFGSLEALISAVDEEPERTPKQKKEE
jgi:hypothetical protein